MKTPFASTASLRSLRRTWERFGRVDPLWAILTDEDKRCGRWDVDEFLERGVREIGDVMRYAREQHPQLRLGRALDFGCGVGRLSQPLADHFERVVGVDIATSMVERARSLNRHGDRVTYRVETSGDLSSFAAASFDFVYSNITLQHMKPPLAHGYLRELARVLAPDGLLIVQLAAERRCEAGVARGRLARGFAYLRYLVRDRPRLWWVRNVRREPIMDMHGIARRAAEQTIAGAGLQLLDVVENDAAGPEMASFRYCAKRGQAE